MSKPLSTSILYLALASFVMGWWILAFRIHQPSSIQAPLSEQAALTLQTSDLLPFLSPLQRDSLHQALAGDRRLMLELMSQWQKDSEVLMTKGVSGIQALTDDAFLQAHLLSRLIDESSDAQLSALNRHVRLKEIQDDAGRLIKLEDTFTRFLPQSYVAASFLLAIASPNEIIAIPKGLRDLPQLYAPDLLDRIPHQVEYYRGEKLYLARPHLAFIAHYSHPPTLEMLRNQGIRLCTIKNIDTLSDIQETLLKIGHASNHPLEANLLALFINASFMAIDNRLRALEQLTPHSTSSLTQVLYLYYHHQYMLPTTKSLSGQLVERAFSHCKSLKCPIKQSSTEWRVPFDQEKIINYNPDCLILSVPSSATGFKEWMETDKVFQRLKALRSNRLFIVDETVQESPTQYIILAYFDLLQALAGAYCL
ncbi:putative secreted protein [Candidatus Protochlamydia naegleriophila]|uniref:Putative secreted protein n=1 Tax=Candidatus Protochlamydia naegleriophila TaxID=389348 RepID=A0A0U5CNK6_9BACT|nr:ABC transporter substrate-binding protein [Candidatus Protochlamydia naegleriophila]CUI16236.1 putative secreted protein [Candidatus Protochlamydia naegleriophila]